MIKATFKKLPGNTMYAYKLQKLTGAATLSYLSDTDPTKVVQDEVRVGQRVTEKVLKDIVANPQVEVTVNA